MRKVLIGVVVLMVVTGCKPSYPPEGVYTVKIIDKVALDVLPGAESYELTLSSGGQMLLASGKLTIMSGTWVQDGEMVTFSRQQGAIGADYRMVDGNLIPIVSGRQEAAWRFERKRQAQSAD